MNKDGAVWFNTKHQRKFAKIRLICFPWSGGGTQYYAKWGEHFSNQIEVVGVRLPGRETRRNEKPVSELKKLVPLIGDAIVTHCSDKPFAFFGHSLGIILSYHVSQYLKEHGHRMPVHLFLSSQFAPHSKKRVDQLADKLEQPLYTLSDEKLIERIAKHGGTPKNIIQNTEFMTKIFIPPYRADLKLLHNYSYDLDEEKEFNCPITYTDGKDDIPHYPEEFEILTSGEFETHMFSGGHFYLLKDENRKELAKLVSSKLLA